MRNSDEIWNSVAQQRQNELGQTQWESSFSRRIPKSAASLSTNWQMIQKQFAGSSATK
jgi:hypothetical protein